MIRFLGERLAYSALVLLGVTTLVFALVHLSGDPLDALLPPGSSPVQRAAIANGFGLDRPLAEQYFRFLIRAARGDFGQSWRQNQPALTAVVQRLPATLALTTVAIALAILAGSALGLAAGASAHGLVSGTTTILATLGQAVPGFWLGTLLILVFAVHFRWLPASGLPDSRGLLLPAVTLAAAPAATIARLLRASLIESLDQDYMRTARAKGLTSWTIVHRHALPNAVLPALAFAGVQAGFLLGGAVVVEAVFAYPGIGQLALGAVADRDLPLIQAFVVVLATLIIALNLVVEVIARLLDPRLRTVEAAGSGGG